MKLAREFKKEKTATVRWLFLGPNHKRFKTWSEALGPDWQHLKYSQELQSLALDWRHSYLEWITELGKKNDNLVWWSSSISERNTYGDSLYHAICYLRIGLDHVAEENAPLLIVAESQALLYSLANHTTAQGKVCEFHPLRGFVLEFFRWQASWAFYFLDALQAILDAHLTRRGRSAIPPCAAKPRVMIHSCMDESYFGNDGTAHDRYFGLLAAELRGRGYDVMIMPWLHNLKRSRRKAFAWFRRHSDQYLIPEDFYSLWDYAWAAWVVMRQMALIPGQHYFQSMDITQLVREACWKQSRRVGAANFVLYYRLASKLARRGFRLDYFVDMFENMITEKPQVMGYRSFMPEVTTVGFQHYGESLPLMLCLFTTPEEAAFAPHPDVIVCNSKHMLMRMEQMGFPRQKLHVGPSLRYSHLMGEFKPPVTECDKTLVILPLGEDIMAEMLSLLRQAFPEPEGNVFWLKPHPMMNSGVLKRITAHLPEHFSLVTGNMELWLSRAACVVVAASTAAFEAALAGVPVVVVGRETDFDLNPLAWFPEFAPPVHSSQELREQVLRYLNLDYSGRQGQQAWARRLREEAISPITDATLSAFVQTLSGGKMSQEKV